MINLIAVDLDGTLLNDKKNVSTYTINTLKILSSMGIPIVLTSGRMMEAIDKFQKMIGIRCYRSSMNGSYILGKYNEIIHNKIINSIDVKRIISYLGRKEVFFNISSTDTLYCRKDNVCRDNRNYGVNTKYLSCEQMLDDEILANRIIIEEDNIEKLNKITVYLLEHFEIEISKSEKNNIEVTKRGVNKGSGLNEICKHLSISPESTLAFGDNENDISLFKCAGTSVAMENAVENLKQLANYITCSNNQDGVAKMLNFLFLENTGGR